MKVSSKGGFSLLTTLIVMTVFAYLSISIIQNQAFSSQIDKLKYLEIQSKIHLQNYEKYILTHQKDEILQYKPDDNRFNFKILVEDINGSLEKDYHIYIQSKNDNVSMYQKVRK
ncbi:MAG: hypothetical protein HY307_04490 [Arcobacter sp.]|nr:hypothetical protein [Arcobacter sp.]